MPGFAFYNRNITAPTKKSGNLLYERMVYSDIVAERNTLNKYLGDKLSIPASSLTKENVQEKLIEHKATAELAREFLDTLSDCEFARFSPAAGESLSMDKIYEKAVNLIGKLEDTLK